jgi:carbamoyl-phosphate synthase large subunit
VVKVPRFAFEKFPHADATLTTTMKSVGEAMAIGRNFPEALQKALRSLEKKGSEFSFAGEPGDKAELLAKAAIPTDGRINTAMQALRAGASLEEVFEATRIDPWFIDQMQLIHEVAVEVASAADLSPALLRRAKRLRLLRRADRRDPQHGRGRGPRRAARARHPAGVQDRRHLRRRVRRHTPYHYSSTTRRPRSSRATKPAVLILGSGPNRIGQGVEFDYSCVHASFALREAGYETVMVNCNPETVSTDYDTSDRLYFEPLTLEDVLEVVHAERQAGRRRRDRAARRADPAGPRAAAQGRGRADRRHQPGGDPPRRGARRLRPGARGGGAQRAQARHRVLLPRGQEDRRRDRLPGAGAAELRARRRGMEIVYDEPCSPPTWSGTPG